MSTEYLIFWCVFLAAVALSWRMAYRLYTEMQKDTKLEDILNKKDTPSN